MRDLGSGHRHRRSRLSHGKPHRREIQRRDHALALDCSDRAQPREIRASLALRARPRRGSSGARARRAGLRRKAHIEREIERALAEDGAEAIVLGCAGMTDLARDLERKAGVPVLDGVACAVSLAESLVRLGLKTSKRRTYAAPLAKPYAGEFKRFSPGAG